MFNVIEHLGQRMKDSNTFTEYVVNNFIEKKNLLDSKQKCMDVFRLIVGNVNTKFLKKESLLNTKGNHMKHI